MMTIITALTDLSMVDMVEHLSDIVEKRTNNCFGIGAIPKLVEMVLAGHQMR